VSGTACCPERCFCRVLGVGRGHVLSRVFLRAARRRRKRDLRARLDAGAAQPAALRDPARANPAPRAITPAKAIGKTPAAEQTAVAKDAAAPLKDDAAQARASATEPVSDTTTASVPAAAHCNVSACSAAYHSFRASDCTYQPFGGERRLCTKSGVTGKIAAATHATRSVRRSELREERRLTDRRDYQDDRRGGW